MRTKEQTQQWICKCGQVNTEYMPYPVNAECEKCGQAVEFGTAVWLTKDAVICPQCHGKDEFCMLCDGLHVVTPDQVREFRTQNPDAL